MINGPLSYQWGGTWVGALKGSPNSDLATEFVKFVALDEDEPDQLGHGCLHQ